MILLSVIIPVASYETAVCDLLTQLIAQQTAEAAAIEIICVGNTPPTAHQSTAIRYLPMHTTRAQALNCGAQCARGQHLWFVHADTRLASDALAKLLQAIRLSPTALLYSELRFLADGPRWMLINSLGVWLRSHILHTPFGDQALCISRAQFIKIGGYPENRANGEDHLFVINARKQAIAIISSGMIVYTSARKYHQYGWLKTTLLHLYLTITQYWGAR